MGRITEIVDKGSYIEIYIDGYPCVSFEKYRLQEIENQINKKIIVGTEVECESLKKVTKFLWKRKYQNYWELEQKRKEWVMKELKSRIPELEFEDIGFGTNTTDFINTHPDEKGAPDVRILFKGKELVRLEITGKKGCGKDLWIRPDKIEYAKRHREYDIWYAHTCDEENKIWFIKPILDIKYEANVLKVHGSNEKFVIFHKNSKEVKNIEEFKEYLINKIKILGSL